MTSHPDRPTTAAALPVLTLEPMRGDPTAFPANRVVIVGQLQRERSRLNHRNRTNRLGAPVSRYTITTQSPYQDYYAIPLVIGNGVVGTQLPSFQGGDLVAIEGELRMARTVDARFSAATDRPRDGLDRRAMEVVVTALRPVATTSGVVTLGSAVWLAEATVLEPPERQRHPTQPSLRFETTLVGVEIVRPSPIPHADAQIVERCQVRVAVPSAHPDAGLLRRVGNRVQITGQLDCMLTEIGGERVSQTLAALDAEYAAQVQGMRSPDARQDLDRSYQRRVRQLVEAPQVQVIAATLVAVDAEPLSANQGQRARREHQDQRADQRQRRAARQQAAAAPPDDRTTPAAAPPVRLRPRQRPRHNDERPVDTSLEQQVATALTQIRVAAPPDRVELPDLDAEVQS